MNISRTAHRLLCLAVLQMGLWSLPLEAQVPGRVVGWGDNSQQQLTVPAGVSGVIAISAGDYNSVALKPDGTVASWGFNTETGVPAGLNGVTAIASGSLHTVALKSNGTVVSWGDNQLGQSTVPAGLSGVTAIDAGDRHTLALKSDRDRKSVV